MIVANLLDFAVHDLHYFGANRLDFPAFRTGSVEERLGHAAAAVARAHAQIAARVGTWRTRPRTSGALPHDPRIVCRSDQQERALHESRPSLLRGRGG